MPQPKPILFSFLTFVTFIGVGQTNLVPNASFENYTMCPNGTAQLSYTGNWVFVGASTDYYHSCSPSGNMSVPSNIYGYQDGADGDGYIGMITYAVGDYGNESTYREPAGTNLTEPLTIGEKYYLSFKAVMTINTFESGGASNKLGAKFSTVSYSNSNPTPVDNFAHVYSDSVISDTVNWTMIFGSFVADSAYTFISIGNFFDSTNIQYNDINGLWYTATSYYYIDDIRLSTDSSFVMAINNVDNLIFNSFEIFPNPASEFIKININGNEHYPLTVYNAVGQIVLSKTIISEGELDISSLSKGVYTLQININGSVANKKLIKY